MDTLIFIYRLACCLAFAKIDKYVMINAHHELILIRARNDNNCIMGDPEPKLELFKIQWRMPHVMLNEINKLSMLRALESERHLSMSFRSWDLYEYYLLPSTTKHSWGIKITQLEKPRHVIFALQTSRKNNMTTHKTYFDNCKLINVKLYLNSEFFLYDDLNLDFDAESLFWYTLFWYVCTFPYILLLNFKWKKWNIIQIL